MIETGLGTLLDAPVEQLADVHPVVEALRQQGAQLFDPVRFHYLEVLAERALAHQGSVKRLLDGKLEAAAVVLRKRLDQAQNTAQSTVPSADVAPGAAPVRRETLGDLVCYIAQHSSDKEHGRLDAHIAPRAELKSVRYFRNTWSKLSAEKQVTQALGQAPKNAGPINSHGVALRSLALMRDTSPDYLNRFMSYVDTLLRLDQSERAVPSAAKVPRAAKPKPSSPR